MYHVLQSELLSRRLAYYCAKRISLIFGEYSNVFFEKAIRQLKEKVSAANAKAAGAASLNDTSTDMSNSLVTASNNAEPLVNYMLKNEIPLKLIKQLFDKMTECPLHREQIVMLTTIVHAVQLGCMQSLVWNDIGDSKTESPYNGSPLDLLPLPPSSLLYTYNYYGVSPATQSYVKSQLRKAETCIKRRSIAVENKWTCDKLKNATISLLQVKILAIIECLDKHCYDLLDINETIVVLYNEIFPKLKSNKKRTTSVLETAKGSGQATAASSKLTSQGSFDKSQSSSQPSNGGDAENEKADEESERAHLNGDDDSADENDANKTLSDKEIIHLLCDWATTSKRSGMHRIFYAVFLIKKRQIEYLTRFKEARQETKSVSEKLIFIFK